MRDSIGQARQSKTVFSFQRQTVFAAKRLECRCELTISTKKKLGKQFAVPYHLAHSLLKSFTVDGRTLTVNTSMDRAAQVINHAQGTEGCLLSRRRFNNWRHLATIRAHVYKKRHHCHVLL